MKRVVLGSLIIFVLTFAFSASLMAATTMGGYGRDNNMAMTASNVFMSSSDVNNMQNQAQKFVGQSKDQLVSQMGKPEAVYMDQKDQIYTYEIRLSTSGPSKPHWLVEDFVVNGNGTITRVSTSES
jgi:hypothetical protein